MGVGEPVDTVVIGGDSSVDDQVDQRCWCCHVAVTQPVDALVGSWYTAMPKHARDGRDGVGGKLQAGPAATSPAPRPPRAGVFGQRPQVTRLAARVPGHGAARRMPFATVPGSSAPSASPATKPNMYLLPGSTIGRPLVTSTPPLPHRQS